MEHSEPAPTEESTTLANALIDALDAVLSCSRSVVELAVATFIAGGHLLLEDVPGVGKTTLTQLLFRFYDPTGGHILIDGKDIRSVTLESLRQCISPVLQDTHLFTGTIADNIAYADPSAGKEEIVQAAKAARIHDSIMEMPDQYETMVGERGMRLSGGQKQRLSIARALCKNPEILIFDDSFSALDYKTDVQLRRALKNETKDATTLIVAQRISTILHADKILVLEDGHVIGQGTHKELMKSCEVYRQIASSQLSEEELAHE